MNFVLKDLDNSTTFNHYDAAVNDFRKTFTISQTFNPRIKLSY